MDSNYLLQAIIYLTAEVICVPIAKKLGLSSIIGYLLAGIVMALMFLVLLVKKVRTLCILLNLVL